MFPVEFEAIVLSRKTNLHLMELGFDYNDPMCRRKIGRTFSKLTLGNVPVIKLPIYPTTNHMERVNFSSMACHPFCNPCLCGAIGQRARLLTERLVVQAHPGTLFGNSFFEISVLGQSCLESGSRSILNEFFPAAALYCIEQNILPFVEVTFISWL